MITGTSSRLFTYIQMEGTGMKNVFIPTIRAGSREIFDLGPRETEVLVTPRRYCRSRVRPTLYYNNY